MADEVKLPVAADALKASEEPTRPSETPIESTVADAQLAEGGEVTSIGEAAIEDKPDSPKQAVSADDKAADEAHKDIEMKDGDTGTDPARDTVATNGTPALKKDAPRRKSGGSAPEHKGKKNLKSKKSMVELRLNVQPGEKYFVAMKGYQPWPVIIADEEMLPDSLLARRPVSAMRLDGTYRDDFLEGGKNAKDRRYPVMFLGTNEFSWEVNTNLQPFDHQVVKDEVEKGNAGKKTKQLWLAYQEAAHDRNLNYYKNIILEHDAAMQQDADAKAQAQQEKEERKAAKEANKGKGKRKSAAAVTSDEDAEMVDAGDGEEVPKKKTNKRKADGEGDNEKASKTPKTTKLKLNNKTPKEDSASKPKKESKPKKAKKSESEEVEAAKPEEKPLTEAEQREKQEKSVLYLRHRLQKGFLARDQAPKEDEMVNMNDYLKQLEDQKNLEAETIRKTKVHKVLKAILKIESIPKEDEFNFKTRCNALLTSWGKALASEEPAGETAAAAPATNGVKQEEEKKTETPAPTEKSEDPVTTMTEAPKTTNGEDVSMPDANDDTPAVKADSEPAVEPAAEPAKETATEEPVETTAA